MTKFVAHNMVVTNLAWASGEVLEGQVVQGFVFEGFIPRPLFYNLF